MIIITIRIIKKKQYNNGNYYNNIRKQTITLNPLHPPAASSTDGDDDCSEPGDYCGVNHGLIQYTYYQPPPPVYIDFPDFFFDQLEDELSKDNLTDITINEKMNRTIPTYLGKAPNRIYNKGRVFGDKRFANPAYKYVIPIILGLCLMATILFAGILSTRLRRGSRMTRASCILLLFVAAADAMTMISAVAEVTYMYGQSLDNNMILPYSSCQIMMILERLSAVPHAASTWFTVVLAIQRYICVSFPFVAGKYITVKRSTMCVLIVSLVSIGMHLCKFLDTSFVEVLIEHPFIPGQPMKTCRAKYRSWVHNRVLYRSLFAWTRIVTMQILPCILMMTFVLLLLRSLGKMNLATKNKQLTVTRPQAARRRLSRFVIIVGLIVFCVEFSNAIFLSFNAWSMSTGSSPLSYESLKTASLGFDLALYMSYCLIFILYCAMSGEFRETLTSLVPLKCFVRDHADVSDNTTSGNIPNVSDNTISGRLPNISDNTISGGLPNVIDNTISGGLPDDNKIRGNPPDYD